MTASRICSDIAVRGGSLGAFGCEAFKAFAESRVKIDFIAGHL
jgi:hypothetical protein